MKRPNRGRRIALMILIAPIAIFLFGWLTMQLWNNVLAQVIHVSAITFWQAWGLLILSRLLFGGFGGGRSQRNQYMRKRMQERWGKMKAAEEKPEME
jgi:Ca2+/H+ antiporter, TMEM165/GDT1 family